MHVVVRTVLCEDRVRARSIARQALGFYLQLPAYHRAWSAAGFVLPRVKLALLGVDPRTVFRTEKFHGSHRAALQALVDGASASMRR